MYNIQIPGCITLLLILLLLTILVKELCPLFVTVAAVLIIVYYAKLLVQSYNDKKNKNEYTPGENEIFKVCPNCNSKVKINAAKCPYCGTELN